jgi:hypothetical protein
MNLRTKEERFVHACAEHARLGHYDIKKAKTGKKKTAGDSNS